MPALGIMYLYQGIFAKKQKGMDTLTNNRPDPWLRWINLLAYLLILSINYLANSLPLGGQTTGEVARQYDNLLLPSGYVFSIWGVIYIGLGVFVFWQLGRGEAQQRLRQAVSWFFPVSALFNAGWLWAWHTSGPALSIKLMLLYFISVFLIYIRLQHRCEGSLKCTLIVKLPFSILLAWLSFALIANLTAFLVSIGYTGGAWGEKAWAGLILALSFLLALAFLWRKKDAAAALTFVWAWSGLIVRHYGDPVLQGLNLLLYFISGLTVLAALYVLLKPALRRDYYQ